MTLGLDNHRQIDPKGTNKTAIHLVDLHFPRFFRPDTCGFFDLALGYHGLPLYNQIVAGVGQRVRLAPDINPYVQLGLALST